MEFLVRSLRRFIARDFVLIVAGSAAILTFCYAFDRLWILEMPNALYLVAAGFAYVVGYAVQELAGLLGIVPTATFFKPGDLLRLLYKRFERREWRDIEPFDAGAVQLQIERGPGEGGPPENTVARFERLAAQRLVGASVGPASLLGCAFLVTRAFGFRDPFDIGLAVALLVLGLGLLAFAWLKAAQQLDLMQQIQVQAAAPGERAPQQAWRR